MAHSDKCKTRTHANYSFIIADNYLRDFYVYREPITLKWLILRITFLELSYWTGDQKFIKKFFDEYRIYRFLIIRGFYYELKSIRKILNSLCLEGICIRVTCPWDRRIRSYRFKESLEINVCNTFKNAFKF